ncbi:bifunctional Zinc finger [Babesia duncani]|uniref:E3 ubiquitin protein ligase n=1 Tax=Babesia duncani TaxID=323732 RepID=A0AAD9UMY0_9APIC|nr:bifunctional Zinc finger [Babesia duncani]
MGTLKRKRSDADIALEELPIQDPQLLQEANSKLHSTIANYRNRIDALESENERLEQLVKDYNSLCSAVSNLWSMFNSRLSNEISSMDYDINSDFWRNLTTLKFPFGANEATIESENPQLLHLEIKIDESVDAFREQCLDFINLLSQRIPEPQGNQEQLAKLTYICMQLNDQLQLHKQLLKARPQYELEIDKLKKQVAAYKISSVNTGATTGVNTGIRGADEQPPTSDGSPNNMEAPEKSEEAVIHSNLYQRLFRHAQKLDESLQAAIQENAVLRTNLAQEHSSQDAEVYKRFQEHQQLMKTIQDNVQVLNVELSDTKTKLVKLQIEHQTLENDYKSAKTELSDSQTRLQQAEARLAQFAKNSAQHGLSISANTDSEMALELQNLSIELEEISGAYEEKSRTCDELLRRLADVKVNADSLAKLQNTLKITQERLQKVAQLCDAKVANLTSQKDSLTSTLQMYKQGWTTAFKRSMHFEQQRDVATSALAQVQSQHKVCTRQLSEALHTITKLKEFTAIQSDSGHEQAIRRRLLCSLCFENFRDQCITKCGHVFCNECIANNIKSRNRKCPHCKVAFDRADVQKIYLD